jgi:hypothetical protein
MCATRYRDSLDNVPDRRLHSFAPLIRTPDLPRNLGKPFKLAESWRGGKPREISSYYAIHDS